MREGLDIVLDSKGQERLLVDVVKVYEVYGELIQPASFIKFDNAKAYMKKAVIEGLKLLDEEDFIDMESALDANIEFSYRTITHARTNCGEGFLQVDKLLKKNPSWVEKGYAVADGEYIGGC